VASAGYAVTEKKGERERERKRKRGREREKVHIYRKKREGRNLVYKKREVGEREGKNPEGGTPENGLAQLRQLAGGESAG